MTVTNADIIFDELHLSFSINSLHCADYILEYAANYYPTFVMKYLSFSFNTKHDIKSTIVQVIISKNLIFYWRPSKINATQQMW